MAETTGPLSFPPNTDAPDSNVMPSEQAEAARQKSSEVMAALKPDDPFSADQLMAPKPKKSSSGGGAVNWLRRKFSTRKTKSNPTIATGLDGMISESATEDVVDPKQFEKDGGKGDGVIR